jgi:hypothetical protein
MTGESVLTRVFGFDARGNYFLSSFFVGNKRVATTLNKDYGLAVMLQT